MQLIGNGKSEATTGLQRLEQEQEQMNPLLFEELQQRREEEVRWYAEQRKIRRENEAKERTVASQVAEQTRWHGTPAQAAVRMIGRKKLWTKQIPILFSDFMSRLVKSVPGPRQAGSFRFRQVISMH
jgi:hypothetical protein